MRTAELELRDIVLILQRRKAIIFAAVVLGLGLAVLSVIFAQKQYSATATIEIEKENESALGLAGLSGIGSDLGDEDEVTMDLLTEQAVIMSDNTALGVIERLKLDSIRPYGIPPATPGKVTELDRERGLPLEEAPVQRERVVGLFKSRLKVNVVKGTRLMSVTYTDTDPARSTLIANTVVDVYTDQYTKARYQASLKASDWLTNQLADLKAKVEASQEKVDEYQRNSGLTGLTTSTSSGPGGPGTITNSSDNVPLERLLELNRDLTNAEVSRIAKEAIYKMTETQDPDVVLGIGSTGLASGLGPDSVLSPGSSDLAMLQQLRQQQAQLRVQIAASSTKYGAKNPLILQLHSEEDSLETQISAEMARIRARAKNDLDLATLAESGIQQRIAAQEQEVNKVTGKADQLILLQEEALSNREIYQDLYSKLEEASVTAGIKASNITLVNPARTPDRPSSPKVRETVSLGGLLGLVFGLIGAFSWDYFDDSITSLDQIEHITPVPVIGAIPDFSQRQSSGSSYGTSPGSQQSDEMKSTAWLLRAPRSHISEAYRTFRTAVLMSRADHPPKVILIMSGAPEEGKSTTCFNAAVAFAIQGDRVLYLDADMRRATAHKLFNCANDIGLSNCLTGGMPFEKVVKPSSEVSTLFLLPAGPHPPNPSELIGSARFSSLIAELRKHYDYIFIDSPPVLLVTDAQLISTLSDGFIMVLRSGRTTRRILLRALALMRTPKSTALGIVVNAINTRSAAYSSYGYYGGGSEYYVEE
jgi:capsular exopolysaccharide synthesis family protein